MSKHIDDKNLENVSGGTLDNASGRIEPRDDDGPSTDDPIAAPVQDEVSNETDGSGNTTFGR